VTRRSIQNKNPGNNQHAILELLAKSSFGLAQGDMQTVALDFKQRPPSRLAIERPPRSFANMVYWTKATSSGVIQITMTIPNPRNFTFQITDNPQLATFSQSFDQYFMYCAILEFNPQSVASTGTSFMGDFISCIDYDDASTTSLSAIQSRSSSLISKLYPAKGVSRVVMPCADLAIYNGAISTSAYAPNRVWVDAAATSLPHYGLKTSVVNSPVSTYNLEYTLTYIVGFRNNL